MLRTLEGGLPPDCCREGHEAECLGYLGRRAVLEVRLEGVRIPLQEEEEQAYMSGRRT